LGIDPDPTVATEQILEALAQRRSRVVSLGKAGERYFTFNSGLGLDAEAVHAVERRRHTGSSISNVLHVRMTVERYFRSDRRHPRLTLQLPGREPITGVHMVFVSNVDPWTYFGKRPVRTNPGTDTSTGLGVFALTSMGLPTAVRAVAEILSGRATNSGKIIRAYDEPWVKVQCIEPVDMQADGDYLGKKTEMQFASVPKAIRLVV
jgi:diacylglycerol kinase family enzyme